MADPRNGGPPEWWTPGMADPNRAYTHCMRTLLATIMTVSGTAHVHSHQVPVASIESKAKNVIACGRTNESKCVAAASVSQLSVRIHKAQHLQRQSCACIYSPLTYKHLYKISAIVHCHC